MNKKLVSLLIASILVVQTEVIAQPHYTFERILDDRGNEISDWINNNQSLILELSSSEETKNVHSHHQSQPSEQINFVNPRNVTEKSFQVLLGDADISTLFEFSNQQLIYAGGIPLPIGENQLIVKQLIDDQWQDIGEITIGVLTNSGFKQANWTPTLDLNINTQLDEKARGDSILSDRPHYSDVSASIGLSSFHQNDNLTIESHINLLSVSNRQQAVQFGNQFNQAKKLDVTDYSASVVSDNHQIVIGHTRFGNNSLLIDGLSRRGISWQYQNENELTFNGAFLSGSDIVGYNNFLGLADYSKQYVNSLGFGVNTLTDSRISVRIEGTYLDAKRISQNDFGIGEVASSETNQGLGFRIIATDSEGRFTGDLTMGFSRYNNPDDLELDFGDPLVELQVETALAYNFNLNYLLVQEWQTPWGSNANIILNANHSSADPLYQTLTAFVQANVKNSLLAAQYQFGNVSGNLEFQSSRDNLDNLINLLTTETKNARFSANIPMAQILFDPENSEDETDEFIVKLFPNLDYSFQQTHQYALTSPDTDNSGFNGDSHLPDQITIGHNLSASWQFEKNSFALQASLNDQDNRQVGRETSDFISLQHSASISWQQNDATNWSFSLAKNRLADLENKKNQYSKSITISYNWQSIDGLGIGINYGLSKDDDSLDEARNTATNADIGIVKNLIEGEWWLPANGSISLRLNYNDSQSIDNVFEQANHFGTKTAQLGINLSF